jgi:TRAP-type C4-dicarboxylate transport system permease small subunit
MNLAMRTTLLKCYAAMIWACDVLTGIMLAIETVLITVNVTARFAFSHSWGWMDEFCQYTLLWLMTFGTVRLMDRYGLFYTEVLLLYIKRVAIRKALFAFNSVVMLVFFAVVFWTGLDYVRFTWDFELDYSYIPKYWFYSCMPVWGGLMLIVLLKKLICMEIPDITEPDTDL